MIYHSLSDIDFKLEDCPRLPRPQQVLLVTPEYYNVEYVINPHMEGNIGNVDPAKAIEEWKALRRAYEHLGLHVHTLAGVSGLPDMVFCANQTLPHTAPTGGQRGVVLSTMYAPQRQGEVAHFLAFFRNLGYTVRQLPAPVKAFEGMGDALWHTNRALLWGGYGIRSDLNAYSYLAQTLQVPILALSLTDPDFYHLDTCLSVLDEQTALLYSGAYDANGLSLLMHFFPRLIEVPEAEARYRLASNAHCPDGKHVLIQKGCPITNRKLTEAGFTPVELETGEFLKAGGSVFCMKQMFW